MDWYQLASGLLSLPALVILPFLAGWLLHIWLPRSGSVVMGLSIALLIVTSVPLIAHRLIGTLETHRPLSLPLAAPRPAAIVVLGGGRYSGAPEYGEDTVSRMALERLRYAAYLHRQTRLPILVAAGSTFGEAIPEGALMRTALTRDFVVPVRWTETRSRTTFENARFSAEILRQAGISRVLLVTHAWHMPRAVLAFEHAGMQVVPAPLGYSTLANADYSAAGLLPSVFALRKSSQAIHEYAGYWWYRHLIRIEQQAEPRALPAAP